MNKSIHSSVQSRINELRKAAAADRRAHGGHRGRPSERIWNQALDLCQIQGAAVSAVAKAISVSDQGLRYRLKRVPQAKGKTTLPHPAFMEIAPTTIETACHPLPATLPLMPSHAITPVIELERRDGMKLRLAHLPSQGMSVAQLLAQFMAGGACS